MTVNNMNIEVVRYVSSNVVLDDVWRVWRGVRAPPLSYGCTVGVCGRLRGGEGAHLGVRGGGVRDEGGGHRDG